MQTEVLSVNPSEPEPDVIARAAKVLDQGGLVAFPTETVYGLGARAFDPVAVAKIFAAKGRPANNPLIVHFAAPPFDASSSDSFWPAAAQRLAARFWPGPLTLVLPKPPGVPVIVTAGGSTWAVRMPDHAVTYALLSAAGPLAAPSANVSTAVSPTTAEHVLSSLRGKIDLILDGGPCPGGIESTVLDLTSSPPCVLRPGPILPSELSAVIGHVTASEIRLSGEHGPLPSPGTSIRHYAPRATLECYRDPAETSARVNQLAKSDARVRWLRCSPLARIVLGAEQIQMSQDAPGYAAQLYGALHDADRHGADYVILDLPPDDEEWLAVRDRLRRAATVWKNTVER
ncbi:MAG: L-threonylcarbamoyladenylate synthase [Pirellulales bacterium]